MSCKQKSQPENAGAVEHTQQSGVGKLVKVAVGGNLHRRKERVRFPCELYINTQA
jgi:hypothetical protein